MRLKLFLKRIMVVTVPLALAGLVTAATVGSRSTAAGSDGGNLTDRNTTRVTAGLLEYSQFSHHRLDDELAARFLDRYLDSLDPSHLLFLQTDVSEFDAYRPHLPDKIRREGDLTAAHAIFQRYLERLEQCVSYATNLLQHEEFDFTGQDTYSLDREMAERPVNLDAARQLWLQDIRAEYLQEKLADKKPVDIVSTLTRRYDRRLHTMKTFAPDAVLEVYLGALAHVYDPHSDYLGSGQMEDFSIAMNLALVGIGATLRSVDGYSEINNLVPGSPAARSGQLKPGDRIVAVGQDDQAAVDVVDMPLTDAVKLIRGTKGTRVRLTVIPAGVADELVRKTITIVRDEIKLEDQQARASIIDMPRTNGSTLRLGVIDLPAFYGGFDASTPGASSSATADVARLLGKLNAEQVKGLILDLRRNGGGSLEEAISLTGLFIKNGPVVQTREPDGSTDVSEDTDAGVLYDGPLIVLTSRFSASASEILAGALQDYGRALIVGDTTTFGKGTVQTVIPLGRFMDENHLSYTNDPGALKVTIRKFYRPSGASTQLKGVASDIALPSLSDAADVGESELLDPLPWDRVPSSEFQPEDHVSRFIKGLQNRSASRLAEDQDFAYVREDVAQMKKGLANKTVSLNEADRRREKKAAAKREEERDQERATRRDTQPVIYEITLKNVGAARLPTPISAAGLATAKELAPPAEAVDQADKEEADLPQHDPVLRESERILADYVGMLLRSSSVAAAVN